MLSCSNCLSNAAKFHLQRNFSTTRQMQKHYKVLILGGGAGGCSVAARMSRKVDTSQIAIVEPSDYHYYQPMWTLVGGGMKNVEDSRKEMKNVLPKGVKWYKDVAKSIDPDTRKVFTGKGAELTYDFMVVGVGIQTRYDFIKGAEEALETPGVCSNYSPVHVQKTFEAIKNFKKGNAIFTFPNSPLKCPGAPQKIVYIADDYFRKHNKRQDATITYNTSLPVLFGVKHYADALWKIVKARDIKVNLRSNLQEVIPKEKKAIFESLDEPGKTFTMDYEMLHITPPMCPHEVMKDCKELTDEAGFMTVDKSTLQHVKYPNIFGIGDCLNLPTAKTAAAVAGQNGLVATNLWEVMHGREPKKVYDGYTSCPLVTGYSTCILAEFDYSMTPLETFPVNQAKERRTMFHMKKDVMPSIYWSAMLNGFWNGPSMFRKIMHLGMK